MFSGCTLRILKAGVWRWNLKNLWYLENLQVDLDEFSTQMIFPSDDFPPDSDKMDAHICSIVPLVWFLTLLLYRYIWMIFPQMIFPEIETKWMRVFVV